MYIINIDDLKVILDSNNDNNSSSSTATSGIQGSKATLISDLYNEIFKLRVKRDEQVDIKIKIINNKGKTVLLRDARKSNQGLSAQDYTEKVQPYNAKIMALNYLMAFQKIQEIYGFTSISESDLRALATGINDEVLTCSDKKNPCKPLKKWCQDNLVNKLNQHFDLLASDKRKNPREVNEIFSRMTQAIALEMPTVETVTVTDVGGKTIVQRETPASCVNPEYLRELDNRKDKYWYNNLSQGDQKVVDNYIEELKAGDRCIPSQLRDLVPGLRNAFRARAYIIEENKPAEKVLDSIHTGTVVTIVKAKNDKQEKNANTEMKRLTKMNITLLKKSQECNAIHMSSLNSALADKTLNKKAVAKAAANDIKHRIWGKKNNKHFHGDDGRIVYFTTKASEPEAGIYTSNFVFNGFRAIEGDHLAGTRIIVENCENLITALNKYDETNSAADIKQLELWVAAVKPLIEKRESSVNIVKDNASNGDIKDDNFDGKQILEYVSLMQCRMNKILEKNIELKRSRNCPEKTILAFGCASGENRTYAALFIATMRALGESEALSHAQQGSIAKALVYSYHYQDMIGGQGGVLGGCGARYKSDGSWPKDAAFSDLVDLFYQRIADLKKQVPFNPDLKTETQLKLKGVLHQVQENIVDPRSSYREQYAKKHKFGKYNTTTITLTANNQETEVYEIPRGVEKNLKKINKMIVSSQESGDFGSLLQFIEEIVTIAKKNEGLVSGDILELLGELSKEVLTGASSEKMKLNVKNPEGNSSSSQSIKADTSNTNSCHVSKWKQSQAKTDREKSSTARARHSFLSAPQQNVNNNSSSSSNSNTPAAYHAS